MSRGVNTARSSSACSSENEHSVRERSGQSSRIATVRGYYALCSDFDQHEQGRKYARHAAVYSVTSIAWLKGGAEATRGERSGQGHVKCRSA